VRVSAVINSTLAQIRFEVGLNALDPAAAQFAQPRNRGDQRVWRRPARVGWLPLPYWLAIRWVRLAGGCGWPSSTVFRSAIKAPSILTPRRPGRGSSPTGADLWSGGAHRSGARRRRLLGHLEQPFQTEEPFLEELVAQIGQGQRGRRA
jgi:hypothetical protein